MKPQIIKTDIEYINMYKMKATKDQIIKHVKECCSCVKLDIQEGHLFVKVTADELEMLKNKTYSFHLFPNRNGYHIHIMV